MQCSRTTTCRSTLSLGGRSLEKGFALVVGKRFGRIRRRSATKPPIRRRRKQCLDTLSPSASNSSGRVRIAVVPVSNILTRPVRGGHTSRTYIARKDKTRRRRGCAACTPAANVTCLPSWKVTDRSAGRQAAPPYRTLSIFRTCPHPPHALCSSSWRYGRVPRGVMVIMFLVRPL